MRLVVGLGNPGARYARNRHNIGFMAVEAIARRHRAAGFRNRFKGELSEASIGGERVLLLKPQTFMNASGEAVGEAARFFKLLLSDIIVLLGNLRQTASFDATTYLLDAEYGFLVGSGRVHVRGPYELKLRLGELARLTLMSPAERLQYERQSFPTWATDVRNCSGPWRRRSRCWWPTRPTPS